MSTHADVASFFIFAFSIGDPFVARSTVSSGRKEVPVGFPVLMETSVSSRVAAVRTAVDRENPNLDVGANASELDTSRPAVKSQRFKATEFMETIVQILYLSVRKSDRLFLLLEETEQVMVDGRKMWFGCRSVRT